MYKGKTDLTLMRYYGHFFIKREGGAKNYERDHPLPLARRLFTVVFVQQKGYYSFQNEKINSTREVGFHLSLKLKKKCIVGNKRGELVTQIFIILGYLNFSISVLPVVWLAT